MVYGVIVGRSGLQKSCLRSHLGPENVNVVLTNQYYQEGCTKANGIYDDTQP